MKSSKGTVWYGAFAFISIFLVFFLMIVSDAGLVDAVGEDELEDIDLSEEDLRFTPDLPDAQPIELSLHDDVMDSENVRFESSDDLSDPDFESDEVVTLEDSSEEGFVIYRLPADTMEFDTTVTDWGWFDPSGITLEGYVTPDFEDDPEVSHGLKGQQDWEVTDDGNFLRFYFEEGADDAVLYDLNLRDDVDRGLRTSVRAYLSEASSVATSIFTMHTGLPPFYFWLILVFGMLLTVAGLALVLW